MQFSIDKAKTAAVITIALLMASIPLIAMSVQSVQAQGSIDVTQLPHGGSPSSGVSGMPNLGPLPAGVTPAYTIEQTAYLSVTPNPVGVGQQLLVNMWASPGMYHAFYGAEYTVQIQKPDGTTETVGPMRSYLGDDTAWFQYVPDAPGTWSFKFATAGTYLPAGNYTDRPGSTGGVGLFGTPGNIYTLYTSTWYTPCETEWQNVTVQVDMVASWPPAPLPTDYWRRPISPENREWYSISGAYPSTVPVYYPGGRVLYPSNYKYTPYVQAPNTAHVVWRRQGASAGLIGGVTYQYSTFNGGGNPSIVYNGRAYQSLTLMINGVQTTVCECYNLRTGQVYWNLPVPSSFISFFGFTFASSVSPTCVSFEQSLASVPGESADLTYGAYLIAITSTSLLKWDPYSGNLVANVTLPSGMSAQSAGAGFFGAGGVPIYSNPYVLSIQTLGSGPTTQYRLINWSVVGTDTNFTNRIQPKANGYQGLWNISWPQSSLGSCDFEAGLAVTASWATIPGPQWCIGYDIISIDLQTGVQLFHITSNDTLLYNNQGTSLVVDRGKIALDAQNRHWMCFDGRTGTLLWLSDLTEYPWGNWWAYSTSSYDFNESKGAIIACSYAGLYAFDWDNGHILWHYSSPMAPFESPYGDEPFFTGVSIADGKVYVYGGEHTTTEPITRGWHLHCVNVTTGEGIWKITGPMTPGAVADGYLTASDPYSGYMYVFGKGQSATTVEAPDVAVPKGTAVLIHGTVMDTSPGDQGSFQNPTASLDSPTKPGTVPCVSAASMETQMEYLYMQHPIDGLYHNETITGVPVILTAIDSKGSVTDIGTTTTNGYGGSFAISWTPPNEDTYTIYASFNGDDSYGRSTATTGLTVGPATPTPTTPEIPTPVDYTMTIVYAAIAIIIALVIAVAVAVLLLRKR
jgi:hypothetical protein